MTAKPKGETEFRQRMSALLGVDQAKLFFASLEALVEGRNEKRSLRLNALRKVHDADLEKLGIKTLAPVAWAKNSGRYYNIDPKLDLSNHPAQGAALFYLQEAGAMEPVVLLDPQPGELVLDLCAAPGGKSTQILEALQGQGWLVTNEPVNKRAERLDALIARHGALNVSIYASDPDTLCTRFGPIFDRVLVDAPCSGESLFAKRHDIRRDVRDVEVKGCARRQFTILSKAAEALRPGGTLVYSTCTYSIEENEDIVKAFCEAFPDFELIEQRRRWPHIDGVPGGYCAKFKLSGATKDVVIPPFAAWKEARGLIRHGAWRWNGETDFYALAQSFSHGYHGVHPNAEMHEALLEHLREVPAFVDIELDEKSARAFLSGEALSSQSLPANAKQQVKGVLCRMLWQGYPLGCAKAVESRLNNMVPRVLRTAGEF